jgi:hypothetical protein
MASLHLPPRLAQDRVDRGGKKGAAPHAEDGKIWVSKILVTGFVHENHLAVRMHPENLTGFGLSQIHRAAAQSIAVHPRLLAIRWTWARA